MQRAQAVKQTNKNGADNSRLRGAHPAEPTGNNPGKKGKNGAGSRGSSNTDHGGNEQQQQQQQAQAPLVPLPGERLADFNRRVNAAIPVTQKDSRKSKKMRKAEEQLRKSKTEEPEEDDSDLSDDYDFDDEGDPLPANQRPHKKRRGANKTGSNRKRDRTKRSNNNRRSASPFAELENERPKLQSVGFGDFVTAPPSTLAKPKAKLYSIVDSVPKSAGSLAKREAIAEDRLAVIARYRAMMSEKGANHRL